LSTPGAESDLPTINTKRGATMQTVFEFLFLLAGVTGVFTLAAFASDVVQRIWED